MPTSEPDRTEEFEVLIVGAGPSGLTLACELKRHGVECRIIDEGDGPTPPRESRALGIQARTLEVFEDVGLIEPVLAHGRKVRTLNAYAGGRRVARLELDQGKLATRYPYVLILSQGETERFLLDVLKQRGGTVEWRNQCVALTHIGQGVLARLEDAEGRPRQVQARYLIGCDGARSRVRTALNLSFQGTAYPERFLLADARIQWNLPEGEAHLFLTREGVVPVIPLSEAGRWRLIDTTGAVVTEDSAAIVERFQELIQASGIPKARVEEPSWTSSFRIHRQVVDRFRVGSCFLVGDSAHIHSPAGGQGMNTGIQDAYNLAWKLALVASGKAPDRLLDSYEAERIPIAQAVLRGTDLVTRLVTLRNPLARWLRTRLIAALSPFGPFRRQIFEGISELGLNYRASAIVAEDRGWLPFSGPRPGDRVPDVPLDSTNGGTARLFELLQGTRHHLLLFEGQRSPSTSVARALQDVLDFVRERHPNHIVPRFVTHSSSASEAIALMGIDRLRDVDGRLHQRFGARSSCLYLIRPDGYVGYRARPPDVGRLAGYLYRVLF